MPNDILTVMVYSKTSTHTNIFKFQIYYLERKESGIALNTARESQKKNEPVNDCKLSYNMYFVISQKQYQ